MRKSLRIRLPQISCRIIFHYAVYHQMCKTERLMNIQHTAAFNSYKINDDWLKVHKLTLEETCRVCAPRVPVITLPSASRHREGDEHDHLRPAVQPDREWRSTALDACCSESNGQYQITLISGNKHFTHRETCDSTVTMSLGGEQVTFTAHFGSNKKLLKLVHKYNCWRTGAQTHIWRQLESISSFLHEAEDTCWLLFV